MTDQIRTVTLVSDANSIEPGDQFIVNMHGDEQEYRVQSVHRRVDIDGVRTTELDLKPLPKPITERL